MFAHPTVPWDGDDWNTVGGWGTRCVNYGLPGTDLTSNIFGILTGSLFGYIAAFVVYPLINDYVLSFVIVDALALSAAITVSLVFLWRLLRRLTCGRKALLGTILFLAFAFVMFKVREGSSYLYLPGNQCMIYFYSVPGYLASAFFLWIMEQIITGKHFKMDLRSGVAFSILYILIFSFVPAALLIAAMSFCIILADLIRRKRIKLVLKENVFFLLALILFLVKIYFEFFRTFGTGYLKTPEDLLVQVKASVRFMIATLREFNHLFVIASIVGLALACILYFRRRRDGDLSERDRKWLMIASVSAMSLVLVWIYFFAFYMIAPHHMAYPEIGIYVNTSVMYVLYFLMVFIIVLCWSYVIESFGKIEMLLPALVLMMGCIIINPQNSFRDGYAFSDSTPRQRYEIMNAIVDEVLARNDKMIYSVHVHMPPYAHYGTSLATDLYVHQLTDQVFSLQFSYDAEPGAVYFE